MRARLARARRTAESLRRCRAGERASAVSLGIPRASRLVARMLRRGQARRSCSTSSAVASTRCSQLSSTRSIDMSPMVVTSASVGRPPRSGMWRLVATSRAMLAGSAIGARSTHAIRAYLPASDAATSRARRVFPLPPAPVSVRSRVVPMSRPSSVSSWPRPMNLVRWTGRSVP